MRKTTYTDFATEIVSGFDDSKAVYTYILSGLQETIDKNCGINQRLSAELDLLNVFIVSSMSFALLADIGAVKVLVGL